MVAPDPLSLRGPFLGLVVEKGESPWWLSLGVGHRVVGIHVLLLTAQGRSQVWRLCRSRASAPALYPTD